MEENTKERGWENEDNPDRNGEDSRSCGVVGYWWQPVFLEDLPVYVKKMKKKKEY